MRSRTQRILPLAVLALCLVALLPQLMADGAPTAAIAAPRLATTGARCEGSTHTARERARRLEASAVAKIARYPFSPADGPDALSLLAEAERCFELAGDPLGRARAVARLANFRPRLERDYRDHLIRYQRALAAEKTSLAQDDVTFLLQLLSHQDGPFTAQLRGAQREIDASEDRGSRP
jgi:hypothetical protein